MPFIKKRSFFELWPLETNKLCVFLRAWHFGDTDFIAQKKLIRETFLVHGRLFDYGRSLRVAIPN